MLWSRVVMPFCLFSSLRCFVGQPIQSLLQVIQDAWTKAYVHLKTFDGQVR